MDSNSNILKALLRGKPRQGLRWLKQISINTAGKHTIIHLMVNNKDDRTVPFSQGLEFFIALRRLGKKVWMLQYDGENHSINSEKAARDFTIRMSQFFDHYLKGKQAPGWMTKGVPARLKGIDDGLDIK